MSDNIVYVDFTPRCDFQRVVNEKLDEQAIEDADLREAVHARSRRWLDRFGNVSIKISFETGGLPAEVVEAFRPGIERSILAALRERFDTEGKYMFVEALALVLGQAKLEQRARHHGLSLVD